MANVEKLPTSPAALQKAVIDRESTIQRLKAGAKNALAKAQTRVVDPTIRTVESSGAAYLVGLARGYYQTKGPRNVPRGLLVGGALKIGGYIASMMGADAIALHMHAPGDGALAGESAFVGLEHGFRLKTAAQAPNGPPIAGG